MIFRVDSPFKEISMSERRCIFFSVCVCVTHALMGKPGSFDSEVMDVLHMYGLIKPVTWLQLGLSFLPLIASLG